jgi:predicted CopG family antitoxin
MAVKTITVTKNAYDALKNLKHSSESFSDAILRIAKKRSLRDFVGVLSNESAGRLENTIKDLRKKRNKARQKRMHRIKEAFGA